MGQYSVTGRLHLRVQMTAGISKQKKSLSHHLNQKQTRLQNSWEGDVSLLMLLLLSLFISVVFFTPWAQLCVCRRRQDSHYSQSKLGAIEAQIPAIITAQQSPFISMTKICWPKTRPSNYSVVEERLAYSHSTLLHNI